MPCQDWGSNGTTYVENPINKEMKKRLDNTTRVLCAVMTHLKKNDPMTLRDLEFRVGGLREWWKHHQEEDRKVEEARKAARKRRAVEKARRIADLEHELKTLKGETK